MFEGHWFEAGLRPRRGVDGVWSSRSSASIVSNINVFPVERFSLWFTTHCSHPNEFLVGPGVHRIREPGFLY